MNDNRRPSKRTAVKIAVATAGLVGLAVAGTATAQAATSPETSTSVTGPDVQTMALQEVLFGGYDTRAAAEAAEQTLATTLLGLGIAVISTVVRWSIAKGHWELFYTYRQ